MSNLTLSIDLGDPNAPALVAAVASFLQALPSAPLPVAEVAQAEADVVQEEAPAPKRRGRKPAPKPAPAPKPEPAAPAAPAVDLKTLRDVMVAKADALGDEGNEKVFAVLAAHGAKTLKDLPEDKYGAVKADVEALPA